MHDRARQAARQATAVVVHVEQLVVDSGHIGKLVEPSNPPRQSIYGEQP
jgi:hypothetical protein